jgi:uncharacterized membrane protein
MGGEAAARRKPGSLRSRREHEVEFGRIVAFSDGVFAIAITLLTLNLAVPSVPAGDRAALLQGLLALWPHLFAYVLSFAVVGRYWIVHHRFYSTLSGFDGPLMVGNLAYLGLIVLVPFASDLVGTYGEIDVAVMVYAAVLGLAALVNWLMIRYALAHDMVRAEDRPQTEPFGAPAALVIAGVFLVSIPIALISPAAAQIFWLAALLGVRRQRRAGAG